MIRLSNGHWFRYMIASGAMGFDGKGWLWDKPLVTLGLIDLSLFTTVIRTITFKPRSYPVSNLSWVRPWTWLPWSSQSCVRFLPDGGAVNKVGLYNPGYDRWRSDIAPTMDFHGQNLAGSIWGTKEELVHMASGMNDYAFKALEINVSCPNTGHATEAADYTIQTIQAVKAVSRHPILMKTSVDQNYLLIVRGLEGAIEGVSLNSVLWKIVFGDKPLPVEKIGPPGSGKGGVSGKPSQPYNWKAVKELAEQTSVPVIAPGIMEYEDMERVRALGAKAASFGAIHLRTPWKPTQFVRREIG